ncbi:hypothetical protein DID88_006307 [Monilinia fructigena]|uniref:YVC1 N-terminal linker helical domain-containing protein n=1 Tax=Monilinia fructigena TaxID=38457 RepID=A0A395J282_9HELO|nr:hypothetical protein DID88_006307 [Monilinia fructigena]
MGQSSSSSSSSSSISPRTSARPNSRNPRHFLTENDSGRANANESERYRVTETTQLLTPEPEEDIEGNGSARAGIRNRDARNDPYSLEQLRDPRLNVSVVRPLVDSLYDLNDLSVVYCLLVNKIQFQREQVALPHQQSICTTRAHLCEIVANRVLRRFHEDHTGSEGLLLLSRIFSSYKELFGSMPLSTTVGLLLYVMADRDPSTFGSMELLFIIYTSGWTLDQFCSILEHGWHVTPKTSGRSLMLRLP